MIPEDLKDNIDKEEAKAFSSGEDLTETIEEDLSAQAPEIPEMKAVEAPVADMSVAEPVPAALGPAPEVAAAA